MTNDVSHPEYIITRLDSNHDKQIFSCGSIYLDNYLKTKAGQDAKKNVSVTYVLTKHDLNKIIGYYTISSIGVDAGELPDETIKKLPKYPILPGILLGRLAVDKNHHGRKMGSHLLIDALKRSFSISIQIGITAVIVDAKDIKAANFYKHFGFVEFPENKFKLFLPISTIKKLPYFSAY
ncbi:MAG TPA: GNAT family N-acetyltransferase [Gammaproteobacteria bacterium]|nr:GNAT family N-acetyltransferase [Gammaproteobacteria bacterium]